MTSDIPHSFQTVVTAASSPAFPNSLCEATDLVVRIQKLAVNMQKYSFYSLFLQK